MYICFNIFLDDKTKKTLQDLAILLNSKLQGKNISTWFPEFKLPVDEQVRK